MMTLPAVSRPISDTYVALLWLPSQISMAKFFAAKLKADIAYVFAVGSLTSREKRTS